MIPSNNVYYVYILFDDVGAPFYVGKGKDGRIDHHVRFFPSSKDTYRSRTCKKILAIIGDLPRVKIAENLSEIDAFSIEKLFIEVIGRFPAGPLINFTAGGEGLIAPSKETLLKMSASAKRRANTPEYRAAFTRRMTGKPLKEETKRKIGESVRKRQSALTEAARKRFRGVPLTEEHRRKISESNKGRLGKKTKFIINCKNCGKETWSNPSRVRQFCGGSCRSTFIHAMKRVST